MSAATARDSAARHRAAAAPGDFAAGHGPPLAGDHPDNGARRHHRAAHDHHQPAELHQQPAELDPFELGDRGAPGDARTDRHAPGRAGNDGRTGTVATDPPTTAAATPTTAPEIDVQLASGTHTADDLSSGPTLLPTLALVALGGLLFAAGYWFYVTVLGRR